MEDVDAHLKSIINDECLTMLSPSWLTDLLHAWWQDEKEGKQLTIMYCT